MPSEQGILLQWALNQKRTKARLVGFITLMLRIYEVLIPVQIESFHTEAFDLIFKFNFFRGTGTWILIRVLPVFITARLLYTLFKDDYEQFPLWVFAEMVYISLHMTAHIAVNFTPRYDVYDLFTQDSVIVYVYCTVRAGSVLIVDAYYTHIEEKLIQDAADNEGNDYWHILAESHRQRELRDRDIKQ